MKRYIVTCTVTISMHTVVEAPNEAEAKEDAEGRGFCALIAPEQMGDSDECVWVHSGEIDGTAEGVEVEELYE